MPFVLRTIPMIRISTICEMNMVFIFVTKQMWSLMMYEEISHPTLKFGVAPAWIVWKTWWSATKTMHP